jgi:hypothetical protein
MIIQRCDACHVLIRLSGNDADSLSSEQADRDEFLRSIEQSKPRDLTADRRRGLVREVGPFSDAGQGWVRAGYPRGVVRPAACVGRRHWLVVRETLSGCYSI